MPVDFGRTSDDYATFRAGFPVEFFDRLEKLDNLGPGLKALDLGSGTGTVALGLAERGVNVIASDPSHNQLSQIEDLATVVTVAEQLPFTSQSFDLVTAGQCWHWFDGPTAATEICRVLKPGGRLIIAHFDWIPAPGSVVEATEKLIEKHNPEWRWGGRNGRYPKWLGVVQTAGFESQENFEFDVDVVYSHEAWRGRVRASAGVGASLPPAQIEAFDRELQNVLENEFPSEPLKAPHRVWALIAKTDS